MAKMRRSLTDEGSDVVQNGGDSLNRPPLMTQLRHQLGVALILLPEQVEFMLLVAATSQVGIDTGKHVDILAIP